ncbi:hypothetical protein D0Z03_000514 [Geotrichum reessii]|nr:hypothetical protein D0Z03_000514 [Galactomyces reessii]
MAPTFFDAIKKDFKDVPVSADNKISTTEFLEAAESLVTLFDLLGSAAFAAVQKDMTGNIKKIRDQQLKSPATSETLQDIVLAEKDQKKRDATQGLLWLTRGLSFTAKALRKSITNPNEELTVSFTDSYNETLTKYHNMIVRGIFKVAMKACPYRNDFYNKLGDDQSVVLAQLEAWLAALEKIVAIIEAFFESGNYGKGL